MIVNSTLDQMSKTILKYMRQLDEISKQAHMRDFKHVLRKLKAARV